MNMRYFKGLVQGTDPALDEKLSLESAAITAIDSFAAAMETCRFHQGLAAVWEFVSAMNKYIDTQEALDPGQG